MSPNWPRCRHDRYSLWRQINPLASKICNNEVIVNERVTGMTRDDVEESEPNYDSDEFVGTQARAPVTQPLIDQSCALKTPTLSTLAASDDTAVNPRAEVYSTERGLDDDAGKSI